MKDLILKLLSLNKCLKEKFLGGEGETQRNLFKKIVGRLLRNSLNW